MALGQFAGVDLIGARVRLYKRGPWSAELELDTSSAPSGGGLLAFDGGLQLQGTITGPGGVFLGSARINVVGGAGGLATVLTPAAFEKAQVGDVLSAIMSGSGESASATIDSAITSVSLPFWHVAGQSAARALDQLAGAAARALDEEVNWRVLGDGTVWMGVETWPSQPLALGADVVRQLPELGKYELGVDTPAIMPGVNISDLGINVAGVDHWLSADQVRTWLWV